MICRFVIRICLHSTLPLGFCRFGCQFPQSDNLAPLRAPAALVSAVLVVNSRKVTTFGVSSLKMTNIMFRIQTSVLRLDAKSLDKKGEITFVQTLFLYTFFCLDFFLKLKETLFVYIQTENNPFFNISKTIHFSKRNPFFKMDCFRYVEKWVVLGLYVDKKCMFCVVFCLDRFRQKRSRKKIQTYKSRKKVQKKSVDFKCPHFFFVVCDVLLSRLKVQIFLSRFFA